MPKFLSMLPTTPRAIAPKYVSQWKDEIVIFAQNLSGVDYIEVGYPYSFSNGQINPSADGGATTLMKTIDDQPMLTIAGDNMEII